MKYGVYCFLLLRKCCFIANTISFLLLTNVFLPSESNFALDRMLSAWLTLVDDLKVPQEVAKKTPLFWGHGRYDDKVLFEHQDFGTKKLREQGVQVEDSSYP